MRIWWIMRISIPVLARIAMVFFVSAVLLLLVVVGKDGVPAISKRAFAQSTGDVATGLDDHANPGTTTTSYPSFSIALDAEFPDDHLDFLNSAYPTPEDRVEKAARLAIMETMLLDEVVQLAEIDVACRVLGPRNSDRYRECDAELYVLPKLLISHGVLQDCPATVPIPDRAGCLLLAETLARKRRHEMHWHRTYDSERFKHVNTLAVNWRGAGLPDAQTWAAFPEARDVARLDSLALYSHALDLAVSVQSAEIFDFLIEIDEGYVLPDWGAPQVIEIARASRIAWVQSAKNRMIAYWRLDPPIKIERNNNPQWVANHRRWLFDSRFGLTGAGMVEVGSEGFHLTPPPEMPVADLSALSVAPSTAPAASEAPEVVEEERPVIWVRDAVPIRIPPPHIPSRDSETTDPLPRVVHAPPEPPATPKRMEGVPGYGIPHAPVPTVLMPVRASDCARRWRSECYELPRGRLIIAFYGRILEDGLTRVVEKIGPAPDVLSAAVPNQKAPGKFREGMRFLGKHGDALLRSSICSLRIANEDTIGAVAACASLVPGPGKILSLNPRLERELPEFRKIFENARQEAFARERLKAADEYRDGQRDYERHAIAKDYLSSLGAAEPESQR